jgi:hypothetical protein
MANTTTATCLPLFLSLEMAWRDVNSSFERFCLTAGIGAVEQMLREDAQQLTGAPHRRGGGRVGHRWGTTEGKSRTRDLGKRAAGWLSTYLHLFLWMHRPRRNAAQLFGVVVIGHGAPSLNTRPLRH